MFKFFVEFNIGFNSRHPKIDKNYHLLLLDRHWRKKAPDSLEIFILLDLARKLHSPIKLADVSLSDSYGSHW